MFTNFAAETAAKGDIMASLGIDWKLLLTQLVAFLLLIWALNKWVFPIFFKIVDKRQAQIEESNRAAVEASKHAEKAQEETEKLLKQARVEAKDIVNTAREEAVSIMTDVETKSKQQAEHLIDEARDEITREVETAKKTLHNEMVDLVMTATGKVLEGTVDAKVDKSVVTKTLKELK